MNPTTKITTAALVLVLSFSTIIMRSNTSPAGSKKAVETEKTIRNYFKFPGVLVPLRELKKAETQKVEVLFTTDLNGNVNFVLAKTLKSDLKAEIEKQFMKLHLTKVKHDVVHSVTLNFKTA